jgi:hypothetical protein
MVSGWPPHVDFEAWRNGKLDSWEGIMHNLDDLYAWVKASIPALALLIFLVYVAVAIAAGRRAALRMEGVGSRLRHVVPHTAAPAEHAPVR